MWLKGENFFLGVKWSKKEIVALLFGKRPIVFSREKTFAFGPCGRRPKGWLLSPFNFLYFLNIISI